MNSLLWLRRLPILCLLIAPLCAAISAGGAQTPPANLQIVILQGEGALNNIKQGIAREPIVQVQDRNHKPVAGALVIFTLPSSGPGGEFLNGGNVLSIVTDSQGEARAVGLRPNQVAGQFQIHVTAQYQGQTAEPVTIQQKNAGTEEVPVARSAHKFPLKAVLIGAAAAGAVAGILIATHGGGSHAATITAGSPSFGAP